MVLALRVHSRTITAPASVLDLSAAAEAPGGDFALLHTAIGAGLSVLGRRPVLTFEAVRCGETCRLTLAGVPPLTAALGVAWPRHSVTWPATLDRWQQVLDAIAFRGPAVTDASGRCGAEASGPSLPPIGWIGFISYDAGTMLELPGLFADVPAPAPLLRWQLFQEYYLRHGSTDRWTLGCVNWELSRRAVRRQLDAMEHWVRAAAGAAAADSPTVATLLESPESERYQAMVRRALDYISAGDIYQANLAAPWVFQTAQSAGQIYRRLCRTNPARYAALLRWGDEAVVSISPELFLHRRGTWLATRPIKGTRPRLTTDPAADQAAARTLWDSGKDQAELAMIIDLLRNDLGRICRPGGRETGPALRVPSATASIEAAPSGVCVVARRQLEMLPTVWHTVAEIHGGLAPEKASWSRIVAALCPGGSISGVPKIRAMQIIGELEETPRGIYCGHIGWIGAGRAPAEGMLNIAIRTAHLRAGRLTLYGGAGIVADSDPAEEYAEICAKVTALLRGIRGA